MPSRSVFRSAAGDQDNNAETYYRINYFFPTIDNVITDIRHHFGSSQQQAATLSFAIPYFIEEPFEDQWTELNKGINVYAHFFLDPRSLSKQSLNYGPCSG